MLKRSLIALAVVALLAVGVQAGEIKTHDWPCTFVALEITSIPVTMDVGYYVRIKEQDKLGIKLSQAENSITTFTGCTTFTVESNFKVALEASVTATGQVPGDYSISKLDPSVVNGGGVSSTPVQVCVKLEKAQLWKQAAGTKDVQVATVKIKVKPA